MNGLVRLALALIWLSAGSVSAQDVNAFADWLAAFKAEARAQGVAAATVERAFAGVSFNARVIELDRHQPEFVKPVQDYIVSQVTHEAIARGREKLRKHQALLARVSQKY